MIVPLNGHYMEIGTSSIVGDTIDFILTVWKKMESINGSINNGVIKYRSISTMAPQLRSFSGGKSMFCTIVTPEKRMQKWPRPGEDFAVFS